MLLKANDLALAYINPQPQFVPHVPHVQTYQQDPTAGYFNPQRHFPIFQEQPPQPPAQTLPYQATQPQQYPTQIQQDYQQAQYTQPQDSQQSSNYSTQQVPTYPPQELIGQLSAYQQANQQANQQYPPVQPQQ